MGSDFHMLILRYNDFISIHAPRMGSDVPSVYHIFQHLYFNPRSPHGERRLRFFTFTAPRVISIHAPRMGSDPYLLQDNPADHYFNPRSPHGERPVHRGELTQANKFQSTLPAWGATVQEANNNTMLDISIHAPRMGSDV